MLFWDSWCVGREGSLGGATFAAKLGCGDAGGALDVKRAFSE